MKIIEVSDRNWDDFFKTFSEKVHEAGTEFVIVHTAIFYNRINEAHTGIICYYE